MEFGLTGCSAVAVLKLLGARCCVRGLLLFLEGGDCILVTPESLSVHSSVQLLKKWSVEQMQRKRKARLNGMVRLVWAGWQEFFRRY